MLYQSGRLTILLIVECSLYIFAPHRATHKLHPTQTHIVHLFDSIKNDNVKFTTTITPTTNTNSLPVLLAL